MAARTAASSARHGQGPIASHGVLGPLARAAERSVFTVCRCWMPRATCRLTAFYTNHAGLDEARPPAGGGKQGLARHAVLAGATCTHAAPLPLSAPHGDVEYRRPGLAVPSFGGPHDGGLTNLQLQNPDRIRPLSQTWWGSRQCAAVRNRAGRPDHRLRCSAALTSRAAAFEALPAPPSPVGLPALPGPGARGWPHRPGPGSLPPRPPVTGPPVRLNGS